MSRPLRQETCSVFHGNQFGGGEFSAGGSNRTSQREMRSLSWELFVDAYARPNPPEPRPLRPKIDFRLRFYNDFKYFS